MSEIKTIHLAHYTLIHCCDNCNNVIRKNFPVLHCKLHNVTVGVTGHCDNYEVYE